MLKLLQSISGIDDSALASVLTPLVPAPASAPAVMATALASAAGWKLSRTAGDGL
jgi:hypothetical protein